MKQEQIKERFIETIGRHAIKCRRVFYIGAHRGYSLGGLVNPHLTHIACFEPDPRLYQHLASNLADIGREHSIATTAIEAAADMQTGSLSTLYKANNDGHSSSLLKPTQHCQDFPDVMFVDELKVKVLCLDQVDADFIPNILIIDSNGCELRILNGSSGLLHSIDAVLCKLYRKALYHESTLASEIDMLLFSYGLSRVETSWHGAWGYGTYVKDFPLTSEYKGKATRLEEEQFKIVCREYSIDYGYATGHSLIREIYARDCYSIYVSGPSSDPYNDTSKISSLYLVHIGNSSNRVIQLFHGILIAKKLGIESILVDKTFPIPAIDEQCDKSIRIAQISDEEQPSGLILRGSYWYASGALKKVFASITYGDALRAQSIFLGQYRHKYPVQCNNNETGKHSICAHLRGGDIFSTRSVPHPYYVQPPLAYYQSCISHCLKSISDGQYIVSVVYQDISNPVVSPLLEWLESKKINYEAVSSEFEHDFGRIVNCDSFISAAGSVAEAAVLISRRIGNIYCFKYFGRGFEASISGHGHYLFLRPNANYYCLRPPKGYIEAGSWGNTPAQRRLMLDFPCSVQDINIKANNLADNDSFFYP